MAEKMDVEQLLRDAMPVNRREAREIAQEEVAHGMSRLRDYYDMRYAVLTPETPPTPTDSAVPEPADVWELNLCEASRLHLRPGILYRFSIDPECALCIESGEEAEIKPPDAPPTAVDEAVDAICEGHSEADCQAIGRRLIERHAPEGEGSEGPKVVGYVGSDEPLKPGYEALMFGSASSSKRHPVILLSDHEATVQRLRERLGEVDKMYRNRDGRLEEAKTEIARLKAERDAYADPANWEAREMDHAGNWYPRAHKFCKAFYVGPTPSDSTEADEGESVEGIFALGYMGSWGVQGAGVSPNWPDKTRVRITPITPTEES